MRFERFPAFPIDRWWFRWGLLARLAILLVLAHAYDVPVFQDVSNRLLAGEGIYAPFTGWLAEHGDGYYAYPPLYAYMLWLSGWLAATAGSHWWIHQVLIKAWIVLADFGVFVFLRRLSPAAARTYWSLWIVPLVAIGYAQPDLWVGLALAAAYGLARQGHWAGVGFLLAAGIGLKITPLVLLPFLVLFLAQGKHWRGLGQMSAALAAGLLLTWVPYALVFGDAGEFVRIVEYHLTRPPFGMTAITGVQLVGDALWGLNTVAGTHPWEASVLSLSPQHLDAIYALVPPLGFGLLAVMALIRRWRLSQVFLLPMIGFLLLNRVVNEQYLLQVLPLLLLVALGAEARLIGPYVAYVLTAGTPLRFFPPQFGLPLSLETLLPESIRAAVAPWLALTLAGATGLAALACSGRLIGLFRAMWPPGGTLPERVLPRLACGQPSRRSTENWGIPAVRP